MKTQATYRAVVLSRVGGPEALEFSRQPQRAPGQGEVLVRVLAAGVAFAQVLMRRGIYAYAPPMPFIPGAEITGEIIALGSDVEGWAVGDRVAALAVAGGYAELAILPAASLVRVPAWLDPAEVAALPMSYVTAYQLLHRVAHVERGESVLVHGAAGGVGTALLQLALLSGVRVIGTASTTKLELVRSLGATPLDYLSGDVARRARDLVGSPLDVALDPLGGDHVLESAAALRPGGRLVVYGYSGPGAATPQAAAALKTRMADWNADPHGIRATTYSLGALSRECPSLIQQDLAHLVGLLVAGQIRPVITDRLPLHDAARAHALLESGRVTGKLVLIPNQS